MFAEDRERDTNYERLPVMRVTCEEKCACAGWEEIRRRLALRMPEQGVMVVECYPGVTLAQIRGGLEPLGWDQIICSDTCALDPHALDDLLKEELTDDKFFGHMTKRRLADVFVPQRLESARRACKTGRVLIYGVGASLVHPGDVQIMADLTRWEIQLRYRRGMMNWRTAQCNASRLGKFKRGYFAEWRWADGAKEALLATMDFYLDMTRDDAPAMVEGASYRNALMQVVRRPFRLTPYFDPGVWGGDWMKRHFSLPDNGSNYAWSFDGVPEENSLTLAFDQQLIQTPAMNLVLSYPQELLGERVYRRFGKEFPIRFDLLDTVNGQNLSLQVHPLQAYIQEHFGLTYTQDESYYILDTKGEGACVYLGLREGVQPEALADALQAAQDNGKFPAEQYVNRIPVKKHDHVLIPVGTIHASGADTMVLEISATPYIFTFKLWDWGRLDLDGKPRPIHLKHGLANIQWQRDTPWVKSNLVNAGTVLYAGEHGQVERTGLHALEFIDTYRVTTAGALTMPRNDSVHVLNLVEGRQARLESPTGAFPPLVIHYAETCILPEAAGTYTISAMQGECIKVIVACIRAQDGEEHES